VLNRVDVLALEPSLKGVRYAVRYPDSRRTTNPQALVRRFASRFVELGGVLVRDQALGFRFDDMKLRAVLGREADYECQGYPSEPTSPPPLRRERDAKAVRREDGPGWAGDPGGRAASAGPSSAWGSR